MSDLKVTITSWGQVLLDKRELKALMRGAGNDVRSKTAKLINSGSGGGRHYRGGGGAAYRGNYVAAAYAASAPGEPPVRVSGTLRSMLKTYVYASGEGFAVRARAFYALFLEVGARGGGNPYGGRPGAAKVARARRTKRARSRYARRVLMPRPFLDAVMAREQSGLEQRVRKALTSGLTWKQTK